MVTQCTVPSGVFRAARLVSLSFKICPQRHGPTMAFLRQNGSSVQGRFSDISGLINVPAQDTKAERGVEKLEHSFLSLGAV